MFSLLEAVSSNSPALEQMALLQAGRKGWGFPCSLDRSNRSPAGACKAEAPQRARPAPRQQARLRGRERERRATYAVCIAGRAGGGGGARAGRLGSARAGLGRSSPAPV